MSVEEQIEGYLAGHPEPKQTEMRTLHERTIQTLPGTRLWFSDGKDASGKVVTNPSIGYGFYTIRYADGTTKEFYQIGLSANKTGISVYILGLDDKTALARLFSPTIGKATITGYCIRFKRLGDIDTDVLQQAIRYGADAS